MISKKELLDITGISYGQLYRWKREGLIPEEWFVKKSSYTGQETYFPKDKMIERVNTIQKLKDQYSLEELAKILSPDAEHDLEMDASKIEKMEEIDTEVLELYKKYTQVDELKFYDFVMVMAFTKIKKNMNATNDKFYAFMEKSASRLKKCGNIQYIVVVLQVHEEYIMMLFKESMARDMDKEDKQFLFDPDMKFVCEISLTELNDEFRKKNKQFFMGG